MNTKKAQIVAILSQPVVLVILLVLAILFFVSAGFLSIIGTNERTISWNGYETKITSSTDFIKKPCQGYPTEVGGYVSPNDDASGVPLSVRSVATIDRGCAGDASAGADIKIENPKSYEQIFIPMSGNAEGGVNNMYGTLSVVLSQESGNSLTLFSYEDYPKDFSKGQKPSSVLLRFDGDFLFIPSLGATFQMKNDDPLHLIVKTSTYNAGNRDFANANVLIEPFQEVKKATPVTTQPVEEQPIGDVAELVDELQNTIDEKEKAGESATEEKIQLETIKSQLTPWQRFIIWIKNIF